MENNSRRKIDRVYIGGLITLFIAFLTQGIGVLLYAGRLDQRVIYMEEKTTEISEMDMRIINNTLRSTANKENSTKIIKLLEKIDNRQRNIELKVERLTR